MRLKRHALCLSAIILLSGCATTPPYDPEISSSMITLQDVCRANNVDYTWDPVSQTITLSHRGVKAQGLVGSNIVVIGKQRVFLSEALRRQRGRVIVPKDFEYKVIKPYASRKAARDTRRLKKFREIVIDAGHGGKDPGAVGHSSLHEKDVVLDLAKRVRRKLEHHGIKVHMTRTRDEFISLQGRTEFASKTKADLFVSIHANSSKAKSARGFEVFHMKPYNGKDRRESVRMNNHRSLMRNLDMDEKAKGLRSIVEDMLYANKMSISPELSRSVAKQVPRSVKLKSRGSKPERFYVLRNTPMPAILIELGFLSNPQEEKKFKSNSYRQKMAEAITRSILNYANDS